MLTSATQGAGTQGQCRGHPINYNPAPSATCANCCASATIKYIPPFHVRNCYTGKVRMKTGHAFIRPLALLTLLITGVSAQFDLSGILREHLSAAVMQQSSAMPPQGGPAALNMADNSINEEQYQIGAGDVFFIAVVGLPSEQYTAEVNQNGDLVINPLGILPLGKISLAEAKQSIQGMVKEKLRRPNEVYVALARTKNVSVFVSGAVSKPGTYTVSGTSRLVDVINLANAHTPLQSMEVNHREVSITGQDIRYFDLFAALSAGDSTQNPYVYAGDHIHLPARVRSIYVGGEIAVPGPGTFPIRENERVGDLLRLFSLTDCADLSRLHYTSSANARAESGALETLADISLANTDALVVGSQQGCRHPSLVNVKGNVNRRGVFPIVENQTTVGEVLSFAGGVNVHGDADRVAIIRFSPTTQRSFGAPESLLKMAQLQPLMSVTSPGITSSYTRMYTTKDYAIIPVSQAGTSAPLVNGDIIVVPPRGRVVHVSGNVAIPGGYPFQTGNRPHDYIRAAGGYTRRADRRNVLVVADYGDALLLRDDDTVEPGDIVLVPDGMQDRFFQSILVPLISATSTVVLAATTLIATFR